MSSTLSYALPSSVGIQSIPLLTTNWPCNLQNLSLPKIGTLIPNRIFIGGINTMTTEDELREYFTPYGSVKDVKIIYDRSGLSKGSYGFVTFEKQEVVDEILKREKTESFIFKDRKLNIGHAIRKQAIVTYNQPVSIPNQNTILVASENLKTILQLPNQSTELSTRNSCPNIAIVNQSPQTNNAGTQRVLVQAQPNYSNCTQVIRNSPKYCINEGNNLASIYSNNDFQENIANFRGVNAQKRLPTNASQANGLNSVLHHSNNSLSHCHDLQTTNSNYQGNTVNFSYDESSRGQYLEASQDSMNKLCCNCEMHHSKFSRILNSRVTTTDNLFVPIKSSCDIDKNNGFAAFKQTKEWPTIEYLRGSSIWNEQLPVQSQLSGGEINWPPAQSQINDVKNGDTSNCENFIPIHPNCLEVPRMNDSSPSCSDSGRHSMGSGLDACLYSNNIKSEDSMETANRVDQIFGSFLNGYGSKASGDSI